MIHMIEDLCTDWRYLDARLATVSNEIETLSEQDDGAKRLMTVPGIGPIISTATVAAIGSGDVFSKGRDFGAWLGLVPRQMSTGGRTILGPISKRGNRYLRMLFVQAARAVLLRPQSWEKRGVYTENLIRIDGGGNRLTSAHNDRAVVFYPGRRGLAVKVEEPA